VEAVPFRSANQPSYDDRAIALSFGSKRIFEGIGLWPDLKADATPIKRIHVSERGAFGATHIDHEEERVEALGYVITARDIGRALIARLQTLDNIQIYSPAVLNALELEGEHATLGVALDDKQTQLQSTLVVAADGGDSTARQLAGIGVKEVDYRQSAIIANVSTDFFHDYVAYERFTPHGPLALLPMADGRCALVWTHASDVVADVADLDDAQFLARLQDAFGERLGAFTKIGKRAVYPLTLVHARKQIQQRLALIGNAAHTLHPIAGQGFNLGMRDVAVLAQTVVDAHRAGRDIGAPEALNAYAAWRASDHRKIIGFTDGLVKLFSNRVTPLKIGRSSGLFALDLFPAGKHALSQQTMGMAGKLPRLVRGLAL
jgi:2-octaprenyl-6-methoxyphenol hydroxylase